MQNFTLYIFNIYTIFFPVTYYIQENSRYVAFI